MIATTTHAFYKIPNNYTEEQEALHKTLKLMHSMASDMLQSKATLFSEALVDVYRELSILIDKFATRQWRVEARNTVATPTNIPANIPSTTPVSIPQMVTCIPTNLPLARTLSAVAS